MDATESLKATENSLRDLVSFTLSKKFGETWPQSCGISADRVGEWASRRAVDEKKFGYSDPRLIYYADFYDIKSIIKKNWDNGLSEVFGNLRKLEVLLSLLEDFRNPDAHRRELLPYQIHLLLGASGYIMASITSYFSKMDTGESYYPRIGAVQDSLGNTWATGQNKTLNTKCVLRPGSQLQIKVTASDPLGDPLEFAALPGCVPYDFTWNNNGNFILNIEKRHVGEVLWVYIAVRSPREFHAISAVGLGPVDDKVTFGYEVLPPRV